MVSVDDTLGELQIGGDGFLLPMEEDHFRSILGRDGRAFAFSPGGDQVSRPDNCRVDGYLHDTIRAMEPQAGSSAKSSHLEADGAVEAESGDGHPRAVECLIFQSLVYDTQKER